MSDARQATLWIQWKGTPVCADFRCKCGHHVHICGEDFLYSIRCYACGQNYNVPPTIVLEETTADEVQDPYVARDDDQTSRDGST